VNVLQYFQQSGLMIISHQPLKGLNSLNGKRVGHFRTGASMVPIAIGRKAKLNIDWVPFISHANLYLSGAIDATLAMSYNEYFQLKTAGQRLKKEQMLYLRDIGYNVPEDGLYVTKDFFKKHREEVLKFAEATRRGWEWAAQHPKETLDLVMLYMRQNNVPSNVYAQRWMLEECLKLLTDPKTGKRTYRLDPQAFELTSRILYEGSIIKKPITYQQIMQP
jgi:NitT/TauT family transport system substrate-binding protein